MSSRLSILAGLLVGIAVAALVLGAIVAFTPDPVPPSSPASSPAPSGAGTVRVDQAGPALAARQVGRGTVDFSSLRGEPVRVNHLATVRHGALGGIGPGAMVEGLSSVRPGVGVTP